MPRGFLQGCARRRMFLTGEGFGGVLESSQKLRDFIKTFQNPVAERPHLVIGRIHVGNHDDRTGGGMGRPDAVEAVLHDQAVLRREVQPVCGNQIHVGGGFSLCDLAAAKAEFQIPVYTGQTAEAKRPLPVRFAELLGAMKVAWTSHEPRNEKGQDAVIFEFYRPRISFK